MSSGERDDLDADKTRLTKPSPDDQKTRSVGDLGAVAELRAALVTPGSNAADRQTLPLYAMPDSIVVGRGTACDWQLDDASLSRKHAQFRWSGPTGGLTVEDLGSANGTRVNGRPARGATPVSPGEPVQLGTVIITLELKGASVDAQATRLVAQPEAAPRADESEPSLTPLPPGKTVVRPQPERGPANQHAQVFRPERDAAPPDEPTRSWDPRAVLVRAAEKAFDPEWLDQVKNMWRTNRRPLVLAGAAAWIAILLIVWASVEKPELPEEDPFATAPPRASDKHKPANDAPAQNPGAAAQNPGALAQNPGAAAQNPGALAQNPPTAPPANPTVPSSAESERADQLERAIAAYDQGRMPEALALFKQLATDPKDVAAQFMVGLIESRQGGAP